MSGDSVIPTWEQVSGSSPSPPLPSYIRLKSRYEAGQREHGDDWTNWPVERFAKEIREEMDDITIYQMMRAYVNRERGGKR